MKLYNSYCYLDLQSVADSIQSSLVFGDGSFISSVVVNFDDLIITKSTGVIFIFTPPNCSQLGFDNSFTGLTISDSIELSWLVVAVLVSAYAIKILRRGF